MDLNGDRNPFSHHLVWSPHKKMGLPIGTHWELEWNMLETNEKIKKQFFLVGSEIWCNFIAHLNNYNYMFSIHSNHTVVNEVQYSRIMGHIQSFNSFFNCKTLHTIVVNDVYINCDKLLRETTCSMKWGLTLWTFFPCHHQND